MPDTNADARREAIHARLVSRWQGDLATLATEGTPLGASSAAMMEAALAARLACLGPRGFARFLTTVLARTLDLEADEAAATLHS